ncbi:MAG: hypothetical protein HW421_2089 [Ignavibacteria bacterium]|nr:hypothetical protein [Ignavibacteria bacterium]
MPNLKKNIFNIKNLNNILNRIDKTNKASYDGKQAIITKWINFINSGNIKTAKESATKPEFINDIFTHVLGFQNRINSPKQWNLNPEQLTTIDSKSADAALGFFSNESENIRVAVEIKDANTTLDDKQHRHNDTRTPIEQAFSYQHKIGKSCKWVIVSNFIEIRLYHQSSSTEYEEFFIEELGTYENFRKFFYLMSKENLINERGDSVIDILYAKNETDEKNISKEFYLVYKDVRSKLFEHLKQNNKYHINIRRYPFLVEDEFELFLFEKTQNILDRIIFISFCTDNGLLPSNLLRDLINDGKKSFISSDTKIWDELKGLFGAINNGSVQHKINKFNGGLFEEDKALDNFVLKDKIFDEILRLIDYDFESDIDVNILGHIFEQSISDIEEIKAGIEGKVFDKKTSKRKKEGIYYTPEYITKYIVENAIGGWLEDRKKELGFYEKHLDFWLAYKKILMEIKVLDPACGSGAFLNQAFNFLYAEGQKVNDKITELSGGQGELFALDKHILLNNLFGVDLNNESVEITKLSLWIKTANSTSELTALDDNIKCGNSLIDDPDIAGDKAFNWFKEFPQVFPGYRDYSKKKSKDGKESEQPYPIKFRYSTYQDIKEWKLKDSGSEYNAGYGTDEIEENQAMTVQEPSFSYKPQSKGYEKHGFDVIISNPPYVRGRELEENERRFLDKYDISSNDTAILFIKQGFELINNKGLLSFIVPKSLLYASNWGSIREQIYDHLTRLIDCGKVWNEVLLEQVIFVISKP